MNLHNYTQSQNTNIYLSAANRLKYTVEVINPEVSYALISNGTKKLKVYKNILDLDTVVTAYTARNKYLANLLLKKHFPALIPETRLFMYTDTNIIERAIDVANEYKFRIVVKPNISSSGRDVAVLPENKTALSLAINNIIKQGKDVIIQEYLTGTKEYRAVLYRNKLVDILERRAAHVSGDGTKTIQELVDIQNDFRKLHGYKLLEINSEVKAKLAAKKINLSYVPKPQEQIRLKSVVNFDQGGDVLRIDSKLVNPGIIKILEDISLKSRLNFIGIDLIADDITQEAVENIGINEVNAHPMPGIHHYADLVEGNPLYTSMKLLSMIMG